MCSETSRPTHSKLVRIIFRVRLPTDEPRPVRCWWLLSTCITIASPFSCLDHLGISGQPLSEISHMATRCDGDPRDRTVALRYPDLGSGTRISHRLVSLLFWAIKAGEFRRLCFLLLLLAAAAWTAFNPELSQRIFLHQPIIVLIAAGTVIVLLRGHGLHGWPAAFLAVPMFVLPSGGFKTQLACNILNAWLLGAAFVLLG